MSFWNQKIINFEDSFFGLDLSDFSAKTLQLRRRTGGDEIRSYGLARFNPGWIENGEIRERKRVVDAIKELLRTSGPKKIDTKKVICSIPESKVFLRNITIPKMGKKEASEAIKWEIEAGIPLSIDEVYYDWQFLDQNQESQSVITVAVAKGVVDDLIRLLEECGLEVFGLEMESVATARSLVPKDALAGEVFLLVDIGGDKTSFIISKKNIPFFTSSIPFSSSAIREVISSQMNVSIEEAEKIKISQGIDNNPQNGPIIKALGPMLENLSTEIEKTLDFYSEMFKDPTGVHKIIICGGGSNLKGIVEYLENRFKGKVFPGDPWANLNLKGGFSFMNKGESAHYPTAVGLAMRGSEYGN